MPPAHRQKLHKDKISRLPLSRCSSYWKVLWGAQKAIESGPELSSQTGGQGPAGSPLVVSSWLRGFGPNLAKPLLVNGSGIIPGQIPMLELKVVLVCVRVHVCLRERERERGLRLAPLWLPERGLDTWIMTWTWCRPYTLLPLTKPYPLYQLCVSFFFLSFFLPVCANIHV